MALHFAGPRPCFMLVLPSISSINKRIIMCCGNDTSNLKFKVKAEGPIFKNKGSLGKLLYIAICTTKYIRKISCIDSC